MQDKVLEYCTSIIKQGYSGSFGDYNPTSYEDGIRDGQFELAALIIKAIKSNQKELSEANVKQTRDSTY